MKLCINACLIRTFLKNSITYANNVFLVMYTHSIVYHFLKVHKVNVLWRIDPLLSGDSVNNDRFWATAR
jgi:hypothetical protein